MHTIRKTIHRLWEGLRKFQVVRPRNLRARLHVRATERRHRRHGGSEKYIAESRVTVAISRVCFSVDVGGFPIKGKVRSALVSLTPRKFSTTGG